jgi:uncharacterized protein YheU (UPF0270 family)
MQYNIIKTNDGYMVEQDDGDYLCDAEGNNLFDWYHEAEAVLTEAQGDEPMALTVDTLDNEVKSAVINIGKDNGYIEAFLWEGVVRLNVFNKEGDVVHNYAITTKDLCAKGGWTAPKFEPAQEHYEGEAMADQEKIELLSEALNNLTQSVDCYLEDKSTFATETLSVDIDHAWAVLNKLPPKSWNL